MMDNPNITFQALVSAAVILMAVWGFIEVVMKIIKTINDRHDREQAWDKAVKEIAEERKLITERYDKRLDDIDAEQYVIIETLQVILDGLGQLKCNGPVTKQKKILANHLNKLSHHINGGS